MSDLSARKTRARSRADRDAVRERLCEAAARLFVEHGSAGFSMRALAAEVGCSAMAPYRYFETKDDLLAAVRAASYDRLAAALESTERGERRRARDVGEAYVRFALENPQAYRLMFDLAQPGEERFPDLARAAERARGEMTRYVRELVEAGVLMGDPTVLGYVFWATIHGLIILRLAGRLPDDPGFETIRTTALSALMRGLRADAPTLP
jgi:AcrR family transcriptional regulator